MQRQQPLPHNPAALHTADSIDDTPHNNLNHSAPTHTHTHSTSHSQSQPLLHSPAQQHVSKQQSTRSNLSVASASTPTHSLSAAPPVPPHPLRQSSLSPSSRNNRVSPSPPPPVLPPPLPSKPPSRSRPSSANSQTRLHPTDSAETISLPPITIQATSVTSELTIATHVSPVVSARPSSSSLNGSSKKLKVESPPNVKLPSFATGGGGLTLSHLQSDEDDAECTIITTTVVTATEKTEETRQHLHNTHTTAPHRTAEGEQEDEDEREPGAPETEESGRRVTGLGLGLRLGGFEEAKEESEISTIPVFQEEQKEDARGKKPKLTLKHLSSQTSSSPHQLPRLPLPTSASRPHTPQKSALHLHADDSATDSSSADSIIITTTTTTTTTTTSTQMKLLPLAATTPSNGGSSAPFVPSKQSNMATTQSTSSRAAKLEFFLHDCTLITPTLYIGGQIVASDRALLHQHGITHVVNACGAVCDNYFPEDFSYYRLYLQDKGSEDVLCILYEVHHFIATARAGGGKVLIHCQQGVSRSTVLGIGYLMMAPDDSDDSEWTYADYQAAYSRVRSKRGISSPNLGFVCQLLAWSRRLLGRCAFSSSLYRFAPHNSNDRKFVNKWVDTLDSSAFDSRFILLLQSPYAFYLWVGEDVSAEREAATQPLIRRVIHNLQTYEFGVWKVIRLRRRLTEATEDITDLSDFYGLPADERSIVDRRRQEIREKALAEESDEEDEMGGAEGEGEGGGQADGDTDRMREKTNRTHSFDPDQPAEFFYAVMGGRPRWHVHNAAFDDDWDADSGMEVVGEERGRGMSRASSLRSSASSTSSASSRISVSVQKLQISPTVSGVDGRTSAPSLSISPRSRAPSNSIPVIVPPLPVRPPRKNSRTEVVM